MGESAKINTPSQHRVLCVIADHWLSVAVDIKRTESLVMGRGVVLCKVVTQVCVTGVPADVELSLLDAVLDPLVAHIHSLGSFLENIFVCNSICCGVVGFELSSVLGVSHFLECFARDSAIFGIDKQGTILGFSNGGDTMFEDSCLAQQGSIREGRALGVLAVAKENIAANA
jgi:hypothetical protein